MYHWTLITLFFLTFSALAQKPKVLSQTKVGEKACGLCAYLNSLLHSDDQAMLNSLDGESLEEKASSFGDKFGNRPSVYQGKPEPAYAKEYGIADLDLLEMVNASRTEAEKEKVVGSYLLRGEDESPKAFLKRIRKNISTSINRGFPPLLSVNSAKAILEPDGVIRWSRILGHWVCVTGIKFISDDLLILKVADSYTGKLANLVLYNDQSNSAIVPMSSSYSEDGEFSWNWENSKDCLFICAPSLRLGRDEANWFQRRYVAASYLISSPAN